MFPTPVNDIPFRLSRQPPTPGKRQNCKPPIRDLICQEEPLQGLIPQVIIHPSSPSSSIFPSRRTTSKVPSELGSSECQSLDCLQLVGWLSSGFGVASPSLPQLFHHATIQQRRRFSRNSLTPCSRRRVLKPRFSSARIILPGMWMYSLNLRTHTSTFPLTQSPGDSSRCPSKGKFASGGA